MTSLAELYASWRATIDASPNMPLDDIRDLFEHWGDVTREPGGVDYVEDDLGSFRALWARPKEGSRGHILLCLHGGGYVLGSMYSHRKLYGHFAKAVGCDALIVDYRRAPEHPHPGPVEDAVAAYRWLLDRGLDPSCIVFVGDSAGGALVLSAMLRARDCDMPLPAAGMAMAPYLDTEAKGESYTTNAQRDRLGSREATLQFIDLLLGPDGDRRDPTVNPLHADLKGLPPLLIQVGGDDVLLDDSRAFTAKARATGVETTLEIDPDEQHVFQFMAGHAPAADAAIARASQWIRRKLDIR